MDIILLLKGIFLGLVEGITEFIPVSSTGHLILAGNIIGFDNERGKVFEIFIQLGAILSVVWVYRERLAGAICSNGKISGDGSLIMKVIVAFIPAAILGLLFHKFIKIYLFNPLAVTIALIAGGIAILLIERMDHREHVEKIEDISFRHAFLIGLSQCIALFPGVSRSGATIMGGLLMGLDRKVAAEFSFFLAIPTIAAASAFDIVQGRDAIMMSDIPLFAVGFAASFISALIVIKVFIGYVSRRDFSIFAYYRIIFGLIILFFHEQLGWQM